MNVKIQSKGIAGGHNTGSCGGYAKYLEHENNEKIQAHMQDDIIPFYDPFVEPVSRRDLVKSLDSNTSQLHRDDAKFYSLIISFSEDEVKAMGGSRDQILSNVHNLVGHTMDLYAQNFRCDGVNFHTDLKYYYTIHEYRDGFTPGLHAHIMVSRKDATNTFKLSPVTNHRGGTSGIIKRGFDRDAFYRSCETAFDKTIGFARSLDKSYDYFNTMKHGSIEEREAMIREVVKESNAVKEINESILRYVEQLANEAHVPELQNEYMRQVQVQSKEKRTMNAFWNSYHSYYKPLLSSVKESCNAAFSIYSTAKENYGICSEKISERYDRLKTVYAEIDRLQNEISKAKTSKLCIKLFCFLIAAVNPVPALIVGLVGCVLADSQKRASIAQIKALRSHAKDIRTGIEKLKEKQGGLKQAKSDTLRAYLEMKDERQSLKVEIDTLRSMLEKSPSVSEETLKGLKQLVREGQLTMKVEDLRRNSHVDIGATFYDVFMRSADKLELDLNLLALNLSCEPIIHSNGGVANFIISHKGHECHASELFKTERIVQILNKWEKITGRAPAYKIAQQQEMRERFSEIKHHKQTFKMKI